jgi:2-amino-4-hydroxy-6-hydroxymethyldihydropteridine diphosphokinase
MTITAYVGLGSNLGDSAGRLAAAREALAVLPGVITARFSSVYRTQPQGFKEQSFFLNQVGELLCSSALTPEGLLDAFLTTEVALGRERAGEARFGPRAIDLDLLLFANVRMTMLQLTLPHPRMLERAFVLLPLAELASELRLPQGMTVREALCGVRHRLEGNVIFQE